MPAEVIDAVFDQLIDLHDIRDLRLTCRRIGRYVVLRYERTRLVHDIFFMPNVRDVRVLHEVSQNLFCNTLLQILDCDQRIIFEDVCRIDLGRAL
jgi:hypothetical protein